MKFITILIAVVFCGCDAQVPGDQIQQDIDFFAAILSAQLGTNATLESNIIQSRISVYTAIIGEAILAMKSLRIHIGSPATDALVNQINSAVGALGKQLSSYITTYNKVLSQYISQSKEAITKIKNAVNRYPAAISCWNDNKQNLFNVANETVNEIKQSLDEELVEFDYDSDVVRKEVRFTLDALYGYMYHCNKTSATTQLTSSCIKKYVAGQNFPEKFKGWLNRVSGSFNTEYNEFKNETVYNFKDASSQSDPVLRKINACIVVVSKKPK